MNHPWGDEIADDDYFSNLDNITGLHFSRKNIAFISSAKHTPFSLC